MERKVAENLKEWMENPSWRESYEGAPSEKSRELIALQFYWSDYGLDETLAEMDRIEEELSLEDWRYQFMWCGNNPRKKIIHDRIAALGGE